MEWCVDGNAGLQRAVIHDNTPLVKQILPRDSSVMLMLGKELTRSRLAKGLLIVHSRRRPPLEPPTSLTGGRSTVAQGVLAWATPRMSLTPMIHGRSVLPIVDGFCHRDGKYISVA